METVNGTICISHAELTGRIITTANLNNLVRRGRVQQVQKAATGGLRCMPLRVCR